MSVVHMAGPTHEQLRIAALEAEIVRLKGTIKVRAVSCKVSEKGALSVYGLGRFPVTLYRSQWEKLIAAIPRIETFIQTNLAELTTKE